MVRLVHRNPIWIAFFSLVLLAMFFFLFKAGGSLISYYSLSNKAPAVIKKIEIIEQNPGKYIIWAKFSFPFEEKEIESEGIIGGPYFNKYIAEDKASKLQGASIDVWYRSHDPYSATHLRKFPTKQVISAIILVLIACYFFILGKYVGKRRSSH